MNNKITYHKVRNYYLPNLYLTKDENLKNTSPLKWTGLMNNYKYVAEEIIFKELIYI